MLRVAILLFKDAEVLDFAGPFEALNMANRMKNEKLFDVFLIAEQNQLIAARNDFKVMPDFSFEDLPDFDVLIIPGGPGRVEQMKNERLLTRIQTINGKLKFLMSVCTGAFILAETGLLNGLNATTHWASHDEFEKYYPEIQLHRNVRFVENERIWTSGGVSAGIDMTLHFIAKLHGEKLAQEVAKRMEFVWKT